jgi:tRNA pseudouridine38-40 synthase
VSETAARNIRLLVAYDGTDFRGFAESDGVLTVMGELRRAIERVVRVPVDLTGSGRTDAGVHAWGQVVSGLVPVDTDLGRLAHGVNRMCGPAITIREFGWAEDDFSARFTATARTYRYDAWNDPAPNPLLARTTWHIPGSLDVEAMNQGAAHLLGENDFTSFCRRPKPAPGYPERSLVRRLMVARWAHVDRTDPDRAPLLRFEITSTSFCHQMVRSIVGTLVEVGRGRRTAGSVAETLAALNRASAGPVAPPTGLVLWAVDFSGSRWDSGQNA